MNTTIGLQPVPAIIRGIDLDGICPVPISVNCIGDTKLLSRPRIALFCSSKCPGDAILSAMRWVSGAADCQALTIAAGFHSAMEKSFLKVLIAGSCSILVFPARSLARYRTPLELRAPIASRRLSIVSSFDDSVRNDSKSTGCQRNQLVADLSDVIVVPYAAPGSRTEQFALRQLKRGRSIYCLHSGCTPLIVAGATLLSSTFNIENLGGKR